jgi:hypothetical protein
LSVHSEYLLHISTAVNIVDELWEPSQSFITYSEDIPTTTEVTDAIIVQYDFDRQNPHLIEFLTTENPDVIQPSV